MAEKNCITYLVGNKVDLIDINEKNREVSIEEAQKYAKENGLKFYEASALTNVRINDCFEDLLQEIYNERRKIKGNLNEPADKSAKILYLNKSDDDNPTPSGGGNQKHPNPHDMFQDKIPNSVYRLARG